MIAKFYLIRTEVTLKLSNSFQAFTRLFLIIESVWIIQTCSWLQYPLLVGLRVLADITLPFLILWAALKVSLIISTIDFLIQHFFQCLGATRYTIVEDTFSNVSMLVMSSLLPAQTP